MRQLLVINPNTSQPVSALLQRHVQAEAGPGVEVRTVTARFGASYIADEAGYAVAGHATLDAWATALARPGCCPDAVLIGCFGDPGLMALRESSPVPATGLAEASFADASSHGRFAIVTGGARWAPMLQRLAQALGQAQALTGIHTVAPNGAELAADVDAALVLVKNACLHAADHGGAQAVIIGGAGLAGMASAIQPGLNVPLIDSVAAGARWALRAHPPPPQRQLAGFDVSWQNVSEEMAALGTGRR